MPVDHEKRLEELVARFDDWTGPPPRMTRDLFPYEQLFSPLVINGIRLKNRIALAPLGNISMTDPSGRPSEKMIAYLTERARGGAGLIISGLVPTSHGVDPTVAEKDNLNYFPCIDARATWSGWRSLAESIHAFGAHFFIQLSPGMGRVGTPEVVLKQHKLPVSASWNPNFYVPGIPSRPLSGHALKRIVIQSGQAAADARALLIDGVHLHGHEGYLLEQLANPAFNRRSLGEFRDWQGFPIALVEEIRRRTAPEYPVMYRIDLSLALHATYGDRMHTVKGLRKFQNERSVDMTLELIGNLIRAGVDAFDVDLGGYDNWWLPHPPASMPTACFLEVAQIVRDWLSAHRILSKRGLPVPVAAVGKLGYPDVAERALLDGKCDLVLLGRPLLADPEWPNKAMTGHVADITPCIGDQEACLREITMGGHLQCAVNPRTGFEDVLEHEPPAASVRKRVAVVGAGPAGITCALTSVRRGHEVVLFEQRDRIGGMLVPGSRPRIKYEVANYLSHLETLVKTAPRLALRLRTTFTPEVLNREPFDAVVVCPGGRPAVPQFDGANLPHVHQAIDVLLDPEQLSAADQVVIIGGGPVGCECAHQLAFEHGKQVTVVEALPQFMADACQANRGHLLHTLERRGVLLRNCTRVESIVRGEVLVVRNVSKTVPDPYVTWAPVLPDNISNPLAKPIRTELVREHLRADAVVLAVGLLPQPEIFEACRRHSSAQQLYSIGDAFQIGRVFEAVKAGYRVACAL